MKETDSNLTESQDNYLYLNPNEDLEKRVEDLLSRLTLDEKISLLTRYTGFSTKPIPRLKIPEFGMTDGPHGCGAHSAFKTKNTYFPAAICLAASWDPNLAFEYGKALGEETRAVGRHCILAPSINIHRTPLCGRNFEYLSEDPFLVKKMVVPLIKGIQSNRIAACVKHFICNNTEVRRRFSNSIVSERALEKIYFPGFKAAVSEGNAWVVMGSYNKLNGKYVYNNKYLLTNKLRDEWNFKGFVVSDWFATHSVESPAECINSGFTLEMPDLFVYHPKKVKESYEKGEFSINALDENIRRLLRVQFLVGLYDPPDKIPKGIRNNKEHHELAKRIVCSGSVLLKNKNNILPINLEKVKKLCIKGPMANYKPLIYAIGGSSAVHAPFMDTPLKAIKKKIKNSKKLKNSIKLVKNPKDADVVVFITGITHWFYNDAEGTDKRTINLSKKKIKQINKVAKQNPNIIVVLYNGGPLSMVGWIENVSAVLEVWQPHQFGGPAIADMLFGDSYPSGKLPTTFPKKLEDCPAHQDKRSYPPFKYSYLDMIKHEMLYVHPKRKHKAKPIDIHYLEGIYVGYRFFDKNNVEPLFPFGFGLSYTEFKMSNLSLDKNEISKDDSFTLFVDIENTGSFEGAEVIQIYAYDIEASVDRPPKELIGFKKVILKPGEKSNVKIQIHANELGFFDEKSHKFVVESGDFEILVGTSSRNILLKANLRVL
ncbi:MAG: beta-glucosidase family protein [Promethearchaeota archaeon]